MIDIQEIKFVQLVFKPKKERENVTVLEDKDGVINENAFSRVGEMHQTEI